MAFHDLCGPTCDASREGGRHRGCVTPVGDDPRHPIATVWLEQVGREVRVGLAVGTGIPSWSPEDARRVAAAVEVVAVEGMRVRV